MINFLAWGPSVDPSKSLRRNGPQGPPFVPVLLRISATSTHSVFRDIVSFEMKTFSEACQATFLRSSSNPLPASAQQDIDKTLDPYIDLVAEVQLSVEADELAEALLHHMVSEGRAGGVRDFLKIAFSHGVMVGIEMEKAPLLVGRSDPPEATQPKEANP